MSHGSGGGSGASDPKRVKKRLREFEGRKPKDSRRNAKKTQK